MATEEELARQVVAKFIQGEPRPQAHEQHLFTWGVQDHEISFTRTVYLLNGDFVTTVEVTYLDERGNEVVLPLEDDELRMISAWIETQEGR